MNHLRYTSPEGSAYAFFNDNMPVITKVLIAEALNITKYVEGKWKGIKIDQRNSHKYFGLGIENLISPILKPSLWIVRRFKVLSNAAERCEKLIEGKNTLLTRDEEEKHFILQIVSKWKQIFWL